MGPLEASFNQDQQSVHLSWKHADDHGCSSRYIVEKQSPGDTDWTQVCECNMRNLVTKVKEHTDYLFRVKTVNGNKQSIYLYSDKPLCVGAFQSKLLFSFVLTIFDPLKSICISQKIVLRMSLLCRSGLTVDLL